MGRGSGYESGVVEHVLEQKGPVAVQRLDNAVIVQLQRFLGGSPVDGLHAVARPQNDGRSDGRRHA